jgi:hypothetical protein
MDQLLSRSMQSALHSSRPLASALSAATAGAAGAERRREGKTAKTISNNAGFRENRTVFGAWRKWPPKRDLTADCWASFWGVLTHS